MRLNKKDLIQSGTNRDIYLVDGCIYKKAKNKLGLESNKVECSFSSRDSLFVPTKRVTSDYKVVQCIKMNMELDCDENYLKVFGLTKGDVIDILEDKYIHQQKRRERLEELVCIGYKRKKFENIKINKNLKRLINICLKYSLEPHDLVRGLLVTEYGFRIVDFGLTEGNYFANMFIFRYIESNKLMANIPFFKGFDGHFRMKDKHILKSYGLTESTVIRWYLDGHAKNNCIYYFKE